MGRDLGRLKHSMKEKCPFCKTTLQLRVRKSYGVFDGIEVINEEDYICCPKGDYEEDVPAKRKRRKEYLLEV